MARTPRTPAGYACWRLNAIDGDRILSKAPMEWA